MAYPVIDGEPPDTLVIEAGEIEEVCLASLDMDSIRAYCEREGWGNAYRNVSRTAVCSPGRDEVMPDILIRQPTIVAGRSGNSSLISCSG